MCKKIIICEAFLENDVSCRSDKIVPEPVVQKTAGGYGDDVIALDS